MVHESGYKLRKTAIAEGKPVSENRPASSQNATELDKVKLRENPQIT